MTTRKLRMHDRKKAKHEDRRYDDKNGMQDNDNHAKCDFTITYHIYWNRALETSKLKYMFLNKCTN